MANKSAFRRVVTTCRRRTEKLVSNKTSLLLLRADRSVLGIGTNFVNVRGTSGGAKVGLPLVISKAVRPVNAALTKRSVRTFCVSLRRVGPLTIKLGYTAKPRFVRSRVHSLSKLTSATIDYCPGTKLPSRSKRCRRAPRSLTDGLRNFTGRN